MLRELLEKPLIKRERICESCGDDFSCQLALKGCWCSKVQLDEAARKEIADKYKDCLCPKCLGTFEKIQAQ